MENTDEKIKSTNEYTHQYNAKAKRDCDYRAVTTVGSSSFCVVLPKSYAVDLGIGRGDYVRVHQEENRIVIEKA